MPTMQKKFIEKVDNICEVFYNKEFLSYIKNDGSIETWTYGSFRMEVGYIVEELEKSSIRKGDRVLLLTMLSPEAYRMIIALAIFGATCVILDGNQPEAELSYLIKKSDIRAIITNESYYDSIAKDYEKEYPVFNINTARQYSNMEYSLEPTEDADDEVMAIMYSSGTTSEPKGVMITYEGQLYSSKYMLQAFGTSDIRYLVVFPLFHVSGFSTFFAIFLGGGQIGLLESADSTRLLEGLRKYRPNAFGMVPKVYEAFQQKIVEQIKQKQSGKVILHLINFSGMVRKYLNVNIGKFLFGSINRQVFGGKMIYLGVGGGLVSKEVSEFFLKLGYQWMNTYASTEQNLPIATTTCLDNYPLDAVGNVNRFPEICIRVHNPDENGRGEIQVKSPCRMKGYFRDIEATKQAYEGEYFKTGDIGYVDNKGYLYITGRSKESIHLQNGEKVSPERIESMYASCIPEGAIAACVGITSEGKEYDDIVLFVEKNLALNEMNVKQDIMEQSKKIGGNFRIARVVFIDKMPLSTIGKVQRYKLRKMRVETKLQETGYSDESETGVYTKLKNILRKLGVEADIMPDSVLEQDLGLDSLNLFELCVYIEDAFHVDISNCISAQITVSELRSMVEYGKYDKESTSKYNTNEFPLQRHKKDRCLFSLIGKLTRICYSFETLGLENIPKNGPFIICANHQSHLDGMWIVSASEGRIDLEQFCCMAKQEHLEQRFSKKILRIMGGIPVDRNGNTSPAIKRAKECLMEGKVVLIHPEGTRTDNGTLGHLKKGVEKLALETNVPILPVRINGAYDIFPKNRRLPRVFCRDGRYKLSVQFMPPLHAYDGVMDQLSYLIGDNETFVPPFRKKSDIKKLSLIMNLSKRIRRYHISGIDNFEEGRNYIICSNHASYFDPIWLLVALDNKISIDNIVTLAAAERAIESKGFFRMLGCIPVNRDYGTHQEIEYVEKCLNEGMNAIIFPEGARTRDGNLMELKKGVIKVAKDTNTYILPIHIDGGFDIFPRHIKYPRFYNHKEHGRYKLEIDIRPPISPEILSDEEILEQLKHDLKGEQS